MANPKSKAPSREQIEKSQTASERIKEYGPKIKKFFPQFDRLDMKQKNRLAVTKAVQDTMKDSERYDKMYSDEAIRKRGLSMLGVASGPYDEGKVVGKNSYTKDKYAFEQKKQMPQGFNKGGMVHRGRKASGSSEKG